MTFPALDRRWFTRLAELAVVLLASYKFPDAVKWIAAQLHVTLPEMPLVHRAYLYLLLSGLVCLWLIWRGEGLDAIGLIRPRRLHILAARGVLLFVLIMLWDLVGRPFVDPLIAHATGTSATLAEQIFAPLKGNLHLLLIMLPVAWIFGGLGEEILHTGFILTRMAQLLGEGRVGWTIAIALQAVAFAFAHAYQGPVGMAGIFVVSLIYGAGSVVWGRNLWPSMIAHGLLDTVGFIALYAGVAHA
jgi:uncharacterized protein